MSLKSSLLKPLRGAIEPLPPERTRKLLLLEVILLLGVSLGKSAFNALMNLIEFHTRPDSGATSQKKVSMSSVYSYDRPWLDWTLHLAGFFFSLMPVLLAAYLLWASRDNLKARWFGNRDKPPTYFQGGDILKGVAVASSIGLAGVGLYFASYHLGLAATITAGDPAGNARYYIFMVIDALETSLLEEFVVLGYLLPRLQQLGLRAPWALGAAALFRGSYHLYQGLWGLVGNFFMGLGFGYLYLRWGRITPLVVAHCLMDIVAFFGLYLLAQAGWPS